MQKFKITIFLLLKILKIDSYQVNIAIQLWGVDFICQYDPVFAADLCIKKSKAKYNLPKLKTETKCSSIAKFQNNSVLINIL